MKAAVVAALLLLVVARAWIGAHLDLMADEAFYWMCSRRLDIAYSDHPPVTAWLVRLGTALGGHTPSGVRWPFGLCGALLPLPVWALTRRVAGERAAWWAAGLCLAMPLVQLTSALATPDAPLLLLAATTFYFADRAVHGGRLSDWVAVGACAGLGMATHYRFVLVPAALLAWLVLTRAGRRRVRGPGPWWAALLTLAGGLPALAFNLREAFAPLGFQLLERHGAPIGARGLLVHPVEQGLAVTPLLYVALLVALVEAWRRGRRGDERASLLAFAAGTPLVVYFLASGLSDQQRDHLHWPQMGYLPLLVLVPDVLRRWAARGTAGRAAALGAPGLAGALLVACLLDTATGALGFVPRRAFLGWRELAAHVSAPGGPLSEPTRLVVADNYAAASALAFRWQGEEVVYSLDHPANRRHGRALQYRLWELDEAALAGRAGERALVILDREGTRSRNRASWDAHVRSLFGEIEHIGRLDTGAREFDLLRGTVVGTRRPPGAPP